MHGPAWVEDEVFVGMQALVFKSHVGKGCVIEPGAKVIGVTIPPGRYVRSGSVVADQYTADQLPAISEGYPFRRINKAVVHVNTSLADGYSGRSAGAGHWSCASRERTQMDCRRGIACTKSTPIQS